MLPCWGSKPESNKTTRTLVFQGKGGARVAVINEELVQLIQAGADVEQNMGVLYQKIRGIIRKIAARYSGACDMDDLLQEGYFGLIKAVDSYNPEAGRKFITHAFCCIRGHLRRYYADYGRSKRIPEYMITLMSRYKEFKTSYALSHGGKPDKYELMRHLGVTDRQLKGIERCIYESTIQSLESPVPGTKNTTLGDYVADESDCIEETIERIDRERERAELWSAVDELDQDPQRVIKWRYKQNMSLQAIEEKQGLTRKEYRKLEYRAFRTLRKNVRIRELSGFFAYDSNDCFHYGLQRFKDTGTSSTEFIALQQIEAETKCGVLAAGVNRG